MSFGKTGIRHGALSAMVASVAFAASSVAFAQSPPLPYNIGDAVRQSEDTRQAAPDQRPAIAPVLPQLIDPPFTLNDNEKLRVRSIKVEGPGLIDEAEIRALLAPYEGQNLTITQIYEAADRITTLYRTRGYLVAKAHVPAQDARSGVLRFKLVPGSYGAVALENESLVRSDHLQGVLDTALAGSAYIHKDQLERAMLLMSDLAGAGMPRIAIGPGRMPETSDFVFGVPEARRLDGFLLGDNYGSPHTGRNRLSAGLNLNSPLGFGDRLSAFGIVSENANLVNGRISYSAPIGYDGLRAELSVFRTTYTLGGIYADLDAKGTADGVSGTMTYAVKRQRDESIYVSGNFTHKSLRDDVMGVSQSRRSIDLGTVAITRESIGAFAGLPLTTSASLSFTGGHVDFPDAAQRAANLAGSGTVGDFAKLNLQLSATLGLWDRVSLTSTLRAQKSLTGNLDSSEQIGLTGVWGIRSFDEGLAGDSGYVLSSELKYALPEIGAYRHSAGVFTDVGAVWIADPSYTTTQQGYTKLNDVGLGYYGTYEYAPGRALLLKAQVAWTYGSNGGAKVYDKGTKGLLQVGLTF